MLNNQRYYRRNGALKNDGYFNLQLGDVKRAIAFNQAELIYRFQTLQVLSAAFDINVPITDDRPDAMKMNNGSPVIVSD
ncbi:hypothetical protein ACPBEI_03495 [Latilactobacillus sakei]